VRLPDAPLDDLRNCFLIPTLPEAAAIPAPDTPDNPVRPPSARRCACWSRLKL
jgi:hypothetical protein